MANVRIQISILGGDLIAHSDELLGFCAENNILLDPGSKIIFLSEDTNILKNHHNAVSVNHTDINDYLLFIEVDGNKGLKWVTETDLLEIMGCVDE